jgi:hypothetical protein
VAAATRHVDAATRHVAAATRRVDAAIRHVAVVAPRFIIRRPFARLPAIRSATLVQPLMPRQVVAVERVATRLLYAPVLAATVHTAAGLRADRTAIRVVDATPRVHVHASDCSRDEAAATSVINLNRHKSLPRTIREQAFLFRVV